MRREKQMKRNFYGERSKTEAIKKNNNKKIRRVSIQKTEKEVRNGKRNCITEESRRFTFSIINHPNSN